VVRRVSPAARLGVWNHIDLHHYQLPSFIRAHSIFKKGTKRLFRIKLIHRSIHKLAPGHVDHQPEKSWRVTECDCKIDELLEDGNLQSIELRIAAALFSGPT
jgi:hypothetical protein